MGASRRHTPCRVRPRYQQPKPGLRGRRGDGYRRVVTSQQDKATTFLARHRGGTPLLIPNPWDAGSARLLTSLGFEALATTSSGFAATLGRADGAVTREEALAHSAAIVDATDLPVSADLERCFADDPEGVAATIEGALGAGLAGCSVEDFTGRADDPIYESSKAVDRVAAAAEAAHRGPVHLVLTARAENHLHGHDDLADTIDRLQRFQEAGADVLYAPGLRRAKQIRSVVEAVDLPLNVLAFAGVPPVAELAELGVARVSVGGSFAFAAYGAAAAAARELLDAGTYGYRPLAADGRAALMEAFAS